MSGIKISGGTAKDNKSLCESCGYSKIIKGFAESQQETICFFGLGGHHGTVHVPFPVFECSRFRKPGEPWPEDYEKIALDLKTDKPVRGLKP